MDCGKNTEITTVNLNHNKTNQTTRIPNLILSLTVWPVSVLVIRERVQVGDDWLSLAELTIQQHLSYLIAKEMVLSKAPIGKLHPGESDEICVLSSFSAD